MMLTGKLVYKVAVTFVVAIHNLKSFARLSKINKSFCTSLYIFALIL